MQTKGSCRIESPCFFVDIALQTLVRYGLGHNEIHGPLKKLLQLTLDAHVSDHSVLGTVQFKKKIDIAFLAELVRKHPSECREGFNPGTKGRCVLA